MKKIVRLVTILTLCLIVTGCGSAHPPVKPKPEHWPQSGQQIKLDLQRAQEVKAAVMEVKGVEDTTATVIDQDIAAAIKVSGFNRLRIKSIRDQASRRIKIGNPGFKIHLTSDKKLFQQLRDLEREASSPNPPLRSLKARNNKIMSDM